MLSKLLPAATLLVVLAFLACTRADYYIDDTGTGSPPRAMLGNSYMYNLTEHYPVCNTVDMCQIIIPFSGTGITTYFLVWYGMNGSATVDDSPPVEVLVDNISATYNYTVFSTQSLPSATHLLTFLFFNYTGQEDFQSTITFDYALVTGDDPNPTPTCSNIYEGPTLSCSPTAFSIHTHSKIAPIIGSILGALAVMAVFVTILLCVRRRRTLAQHVEESDPGPMSSLHAVPSAHGDDALSYPTLPFAQAPSPTTAEEASPNKIPASAPAMTIAASQPTRSNSAKEPLTSTSVHSALTLEPPVTSSRASHVTSPPTAAALTRDQIELVASLLERNVPVTDILAILDRRARHGAVADRNSSSGIVLEGAPPQYDFKFGT